MYKKFLLLFLALTVASVFATSAFALGSGSQVENFTLKDLSGKSVSLNQFKGKVVVLNFWASWCPPVSYTHRRGLSLSPPKVRGN